MIWPAGGADGRQPTHWALTQRYDISTPVWLMPCEPAWGLAHSLREARVCPLGDWALGGNRRAGRQTSNAPHAPEGSWLAGPFQESR
jgi:hypothetical protein